jgi:hypothetical protein
MRRGHLKSNRGSLFFIFSFSPLFMLSFIVLIGLLPKPIRTVFVVRLYMASYKTLKVAFKANHQQKGMLLPPDLTALIATDHPVRVVNEVP